FHKLVPETDRLSYGASRPATNGGDVEVRRRGKGAAGDLRPTIAPRQAGGRVQLVDRRRILEVDLVHARDPEVAAAVRAAGSCRRLVGAEESRPRDRDGRSDRFFAGAQRQHPTLGAEEIALRSEQLRAARRTKGHVLQAVVGRVEQIRLGNRGYRADV